ncbi:MAG: Ig-like domain-containing domain [Cyclobacteriaceae bacterium]
MKFLPYLAFLILLNSCAIQNSPQGGPRDTIPPQLLLSLPNSQATNYNGKEILFEFNEMLKLNNPQEEVIITPRTGKKNNYRLRNNRLYIEPDAPWSTNTTYTISLRKAVQDITEGNTAEDIQLAFSTGPVIDTMTISGKVTHLLTDKPGDKITVGIYSSDTFNVFRHSPEYFAKTNEQGIYFIRNLKPGKYHLYCFDDKNKNFKADTQTEKFGFYEDSIDLTHTHQTIDIPILAIDSRPIEISSIKSNGPVNKIRFKKNITSYSIQSQTKFINSFGEDHTQIDIFVANNLTDSVQVSLTATDSIQQKIDTTFYVKISKTQRAPEKLKLKVEQNDLNLITQSHDIILSSNQPIRSINTDSVKLEIDSTITIGYHNAIISIDTLSKLIRLKKDLTSYKKDSINWKNASFSVRQGFLLSHTGDTSALLQTKPVLIQPDNIAALDLKLATKRTNYIVQLIDGTGKIIRSMPDFKGGLVTNLPATTYKLRALIDENKNGKWDPGSYPFRIPPERFIYYYNSDRQQDIPLRANWEVEISFEF